ncbi:MBOAT family protein [Cohnella sp. CFH 77786]|uniref:MBOAT family O-acyltransferase n=1 Tax=Cohnella sp. CFH 77786 TaxID=2662265 RepID=UPI001C608A17|nr:MBOAT family O-acyltransferase [Cohnella sp. CFH 77786]MBW5445063.1 MBOAT family protein [Cohnella sp. CFH 77786]
MVFSSILFLYFFFPLLLLVYFAVPKTKVRNWILIVFSFAFYAWGEPVWVFLLIAASLLGYLASLYIDVHRGTRKGKIVYVLSICFIIGMLGFFKYTGFVVDNLNAWFGLGAAPPNIALPIGISFFTFEIICYMTDVHKGALQAPRSPMKMFLYVSFFPHLIAGPIIRFTDIEEQMDNRKITMAGFSQGVSRFVIGLGKKVILANSVGEIVPNLIGPDSSDSFLGVWFGVCLYALQIYFDFSGYSDMAVGLGKMFGFTLKENFDYPYISKSAGEFWRRWNISLGGFFRDYVYIPLGGNRKRMVRNLFVVWFLTGLWHGASWNFIIWGLYFGVLILLERLFLQKWLEKLPSFVSHLYLLGLMLVGWVWFYFTDLSQAWTTLKIMFGAEYRPFVTSESFYFFRENMYLFFVAAIAATPLMKKLADKLAARRGARAFVAYAAPVYNFILLALSTVLLVGSTYNPFLYFRF